MAGGRRANRLTCLLSACTGPLAVHTATLLGSRQAVPVSHLTYRNSPPRFPSLLQPRPRQPLYAPPHRRTRQCVTPLLGYLRSELEGASVSLIMPQPFAGRHAGYMQRYVQVRCRYCSRCRPAAVKGCCWTVLDLSTL